MMDCSQCPIHEDPETCLTITDIHSKTLRKWCRASLLMTWAYKNVPEMIDTLAAYTSAGNRNEAMVFPVGIAFQMVKKKYQILIFTLKIKDILTRRVLTDSGSYLFFYI